MHNNYLFSIKGEKARSLLVNTSSFRISGNSYSDTDSFEEAWQKKISLNTKTEISHSKLLSICKESTDREVHIYYKGLMGVKTKLSFSFDKDIDYNTFFGLLEKELYMKKTEEQLSPWKASSGNLLAFVITFIITLFAHYQAIQLRNGAAIEGRPRTKALLAFIKMLGVPGVWLLGCAFLAGIAYAMYKRYTKPPAQTTFIPA